MRDLDLVFALFPAEEVGVAPAVYAELVAGMREGYRFLEPAVADVRTGRTALFALSADEVIQRVDLPPSIGAGEAESIALCASRFGTLLTNDRRARNYCLSAGIEVFDLADLLRTIWRLGIRTRHEVEVLIDVIEAEEGTVISGKEQILAE